MIDHAWLQVSYMAQIIVACLLFMIPVAKRRRFPARFASCTIVLLMIAYMFGAAVTVPDNLLLVITVLACIRGHMPSRSGVVSAGGIVGSTLLHHLCERHAACGQRMLSGAQHRTRTHNAGSAHAPQRTVDHGDLYRHLRRVLHHVCTQTRSAWTLSGESQ